MRGNTPAANFQMTPELGSSRRASERDCCSAAAQQAGEAGWQKAYNLQPKPTWSSVKGNPRCRKQLWGKQPGGWAGVGSDSDERRPRAGLHFQEHSQQDKGRNYYSLFSTCEAASGTECPVWVSLSQNRHWQTGKNSAERTKMMKGAAAHNLRKEAGRTVFV